MGQPLQVHETGEHMRFRVSSETHGDTEYLVDLLEHGGQGECTCPDWQCRCWPIIRDGGQARCKHISKVRNGLMDRMLARMAQQQQHSFTTAQ